MARGLPSWLISHESWLTACRCATRGAKLYRMYRDREYIEVWLSMVALALVQAVHTQPASITTGRDSANMDPPPPRGGHTTPCMGRICICLGPL